MADRSLFDLAVGQEFMTMLNLVDVADGQFNTLKMEPGWATRVSGEISLPYAVEDGAGADWFVHAEMWIPLAGRVLPRLRRCLPA